MEKPILFEQFNITLDKELRQKIETECYNTGRTKSGFIRYVLNQYFEKKVV